MAEFEVYRIEFPSRLVMIRHRRGEEEATLIVHNFESGRTIEKSVRFDKDWVDEQLRKASEEKAQGTMF